MIMLELIAATVGITTGIMGLVGYIKNNLESRSLEKELLQRIKILESIIQKGQLIRMEELITEQKKAIRSAERSIWIFGINALGVFHEHREDLISLLDKGGEIKCLLLDPASGAFKERENWENDMYGRLRAEFTVTISYCKDIIGNTKNKKNFELRLHQERVSEALLIIDPHIEGKCIIHVNKYPNEKYTRGYIGEHRIIQSTYSELIEFYIKKFEKIWKQSASVNLF